VLEANPVMLHLLGRQRQEVLGHELASFAPAASANRLRGWLQGTVSDDEFPVQSPDGQVTELAWVLSRDIEPGVHMAVATDISQRNLVELQRKQLLDSERMARSTAERMNRMKDELIAVLSHELRTPLNAIMGWTHVLQKRGGDETTLRGLTAIDRNVRVQARLISDILDMSRLNMGKMQLAFEAVDPAALVHEAVSAMQASALDAKVGLVVDAQPVHRAVRADSSRLQQIVWNLVSNAIKFSPVGSEVRVRLRDEANGLHLSITDQGQGITPEFLPFLFDRFTQSNVGSNRHRGGLGLGLSIVKQLVEAHGGSIQAHSEGAGQGARFEVVLPFDDGMPKGGDSASAPDDLQGADDNTAGLLAGLRVLVVDDDADACAMLAIILGDRGATVVTAGSHADALAALDHQLPDVMVSDIGMPGRDGYDLIRELRARELASGRHLPAIALTSFTRPQDRQHTMEAGFDLHCAKPLQPLQVVQSVAMLAGRAPFFLTT
jgi:signal transduction histidine kinase